MSSVLFLDSGPLGLATQRPGKPGAARCRQWLVDCLAQGRTIYVPEIADYEVRRELQRVGAAAGLAQLDALSRQLCYLPLTTTAMRLAAELWGQARNSGWATADPKAIDGDVILAAQALTLLPRPAALLVATTNIAHLARYVSADLWENIVP